MKRKYLFIGLGLLALTSLVAKKYKTFWDKLTFSFKKIKLDAKFPYTNIQIIITMEAYNSTETSVQLYSASGVLYAQGKAIANITGSPVNIRQGRNNFDIIANISIANLENILSIKFDSKNWASIYNQLISMPFISDMTYSTSLGKFSSKDTWVLKEWM